MKATADFMGRLGVPVEDEALASSTRRFADGAQYRFEIPSTECPEALAAVLEEAEKQKVAIHRVSQGSGIMLLTDNEILEMVRMSRQAGIELCLFVGPRAPFDISPQPQTPGGKIIGWSLRGSRQLQYAVEDIKRACALGVRSVLIADLGLLWIVDEMKKAGELPANLLIKISLLLSVPNPATARVLEKMGAGTLNLSPDLSLAQLANVRAAVSVPVDVYVEVPDGFGGYVRYYEVPEMIRVAAPIYVKLGLRNAPDIYPSGRHLQSAAIAMSRERVRRTRLVADMIQRYYPEAAMSSPGTRAADLALPEE